jgi:hypothetical protein
MQKSLAYAYEIAARLAGFVQFIGKNMQYEVL